MQLGVPEILLLLAIALLIFGPGRIPEIGRSLGRAMTEFRQGLQGGKSDHTSEQTPPPPEHASKKS